MGMDMMEMGQQTVDLWDGSHSRLARFWEQGPLVLVFLRHYG